MDLREQGSCRDEEAALTPTPVPGPGSTRRAFTSGVRREKPDPVRRDRDQAGLTWAFGSSGWARGEALVVLGWHNVESTWHWPAAPGAGLRSFTRQVTALRRFTNVVPLGAGMAALREGRPLPHRAVALTFDDGYRDNLTLAVPTLQGLGVPATVFLVPGILDGAVDPWWERLAWAVSRATTQRIRFEDLVLDLSSRATRARAVESVEALLRSRPEAARTAAVAELVAMLAPKGSYRADELFMGWDEARTLITRGVEVGSHTMRHAIMAREDATSQVEDLRKSKERLEADLQIPITSLAYPNGQRGDYDAITTKGASEAGFECAVTTWGVSNHRCTDPLEARRRIIAPGDNALRVLAGLVRGTWRDHARN